jgi:hypothetical protein
MNRKLDELDRLASWDDTIHRKKLIARAGKILDHYEETLKKWNPEQFASEYIGRIITALAKALDNYAYKNVGYYKQIQELIQRATEILRATTGARYAVKEEVDYASYIKLNLYGEFIALMDDRGEVHLHKGNTVYVGKHTCLCDKEVEDNKQVDPSKHEICGACLEVVFEYLMEQYPYRDLEGKEYILAHNGWDDMSSSQDAFPLSGPMKGEGIQHLLNSLESDLYFGKHDRLKRKRFYKVRIVKELKLIPTLKLQGL